MNVLVNSLGRAERLIPEGFTGRSLMTSLQSVQMSKKQQKVKVENKIRTKRAERPDGDVDYNNSPGELKGRRELFDKKKKISEHKARIF